MLPPTKRHNCTIFCRSARASFLLLAAAIGLSLGCRPEENIRSYVIAKPPSAAARSEGQLPTSADAQQAPTHRMLSLIAPGDDRAWFLKLVGAIDRVDEQADVVIEFLKSVRVENGQPAWTLPNGWTQAPPRGMRLATITVADGLEMTVIGLALADDWDSQLLDNVNRWRGQLALPPTGAPGLAASVKKVDGIEGGVLVDLRGKFSDTMAPPFAGGRGRQPARKIPPTQLTTSTKTITFTKPDNWVDLGPSSFRKASLKTSEDANAAQISVTAFPAFGQMGDPLENVNRWRRQVGLEPTDAASIPELAQPLQVAGKDAALYELTPDDDAPDSQAITVAMSKRGDLVWFFKMSGPRETVAAARQDFDAWLASIRFDSDSKPSETENNREESADGDR